MFANTVARMQEVPLPRFTDEEKGVSTVQTVIQTWGFRAIYISLFKTGLSAYFSIFAGN